MSSPFRSIRVAGEIRHSVERLACLEHMTEVLTPAQHRLNMSRIRGRDTKPEMLIKRELHAIGLRYRLHVGELPGRPDLAFPRYRTAVFVHGCFWHAHGCLLSNLPETRREFWHKELMANATRDQQVVENLISQGWRVLVIWECALRGSGKADLSEVIAQASRFITQSKDKFRAIQARGILR
jgi:DNA mismatch endonuclease (patch repair protein)